MGTKIPQKQNDLKKAKADNPSANSILQLRDVVALLINEIEVLKAEVAELKERT